MAFGGTLPKLQDQPGNLDHREDATQPLEQQYAPSHEIALVKGGLLHGIAGPNASRSTRCTRRAFSARRAPGIGSAGG